MAPILNVNSVGSYTVTVSWVNDPLVTCYRSTVLVTDTVQDQSDINSAIRKYDVSLNNTDPLSPTALIIDGLINGRTYLITYIQSISQNSGSQSQSNTQQVIPYTIPSPLEIDTATSYGGSGILVTNVIFDGDGGNPYNFIELIYSNTTQMYNQIFDISNQTIPDRTDISFVLTGLTNFTQYEVACYAWNDSGPSRISNTWVATPTNLPTPPLTATARSSLPLSVEIAWFPPLNESIANITYYAIDLSGNGRQFTDISANFYYRNLDPDDLSKVITGLNTGVGYQFKVYAQNLNGYSLASNTTNLVIVL